MVIGIEDDGAAVGDKEDGDDDDVPEEVEDDESENVDVPRRKKC